MYGRTQGWGEWGPKKAYYLKHNVHFADAVSAVEDEFALTSSEETAGGEEWFVTLEADRTG